MLEAVRAKLLADLAPDAAVLDIGGWADPFERADWVVDQFPYESRGLYERRGWIDPPRDRGPERFTAETWVQRDVCERTPLPFDADQFDFVVCSHTLEDLRDPVWVCSEIARVGKKGYIEVPSRLEEQSWGVAGEYVGWPHHHWLIDVEGQSIQFVFKSHAIHSLASYHFPREFWRGLSEQERVQSLWWTGGFEARERVMFDEDEETSEYLRGYVERESLARGFRPSASPTSFVGRARMALSRRLGPAR
jgi:SAM-dependent methyltransferase